MIAATIALLSLAYTQQLVAVGTVAKTWAVGGVVLGTPGQLLVPAHGVPLGRQVHAVVASVGGTVEANGTWELTPVDGDHFALGTYTVEGAPVPLVAAHAWTSGGTIQTPWPSWRILLGLRWIDQAEALLAPRIVFVPARGRAWDFTAIGGFGPATIGTQGDASQAAMTLGPQRLTEYETFEVHVSGCAPTPSPDAGDFDATDALLKGLASILFDALGSQFRILGSQWVSQRLDQLPKSGAMTQRGQKKIALIEFPSPVLPIQITSVFAPQGVYAEFTVQPKDPAPEDPIVFDVPAQS